MKIFTEKHNRPVYKERKKKEPYKRRFNGKAGIKPILLAVHSLKEEHMRIYSYINKNPNCTIIEVKSGRTSYGNIEEHIEYLKGIFLITEIKQEQEPIPSYKAVTTYAEREELINEKINETQQQTNRIQNDLTLNISWDTKTLIYTKSGQNHEKVRHLNRIKNIYTIIDTDKFFYKNEEDEELLAIKKLFPVKI